MLSLEKEEIHVVANDANNQTSFSFYLSSRLSILDLYILDLIISLFITLFFFGSRGYRPSS